MRKSMKGLLVQCLEHSKYSTRLTIVLCSMIAAKWSPTHALQVLMGLYHSYVYPSTHSLSNHSWGSMIFMSDARHKLWDTNMNQTWILPSNSLVFFSQHFTYFSPFSSCLNGFWRKIIYNFYLCSFMGKIIFVWLFFHFFNLWVSLVWEWYV